MNNTAAFTDITTLKERFALIRELEFSPQPLRNGRTVLFEESEMDLSLAGYPSVDVLLSAALTLRPENFALGEVAFRFNQFALNRTEKCFALDSCLAGYDLLLFVTPYVKRVVTEALWRGLSPSEALKCRWEFCRECLHMVPASYMSDHYALCRKCLVRG